MAPSCWHDCKENSSWTCQMVFRTGFKKVPLLTHRTIVLLLWHLQMMQPKGTNRTLQPVSDGFIWLQRCHSPSAQASCLESYHDSLNTTQQTCSAETTPALQLLVQRQWNLFSNVLPTHPSSTFVVKQHSKIANRMQDWAEQHTVIMRTWIARCLCIALQPWYAYDKVKQQAICCNNL